MLEARLTNLISEKLLLRSPMKGKQHGLILEKESCPQNWAKPAEYSNGD
jgi:hypothetical protein